MCKLAEAWACRSDACFQVNGGHRMQPRVKQFSLIDRKENHMRVLFIQNVFALVVNQWHKGTLGRHLGFWPKVFRMEGIME